MNGGGSAGPRAMRPLRWWPLWLAIGILLLAAVLAGSLAPDPDRLMPIHLWDKTQHAGAYAVLAIWFGWVYQRRYYVLVALGLVAYGVLIEFLQGASGYRMFDVSDMLADAIGVAIGLVIAATPMGHALVWLERRLVPS